MYAGTEKAPAGEQEPTTQKGSLLLFGFQCNVKVKDSAVPLEMLLPLQAAVIVVPDSPDISASLFLLTLFSFSIAEISVFAVALSSRAEIPSSDRFL